MLAAADAARERTVVATMLIFMMAASVRFAYFY